MEQDVRRLHLDVLRDSMFEAALGVWEQTRRAEDTASALTAMKPLCDSTTNLYCTDMSASEPWGWSIAIANEAVNMHRSGGDRFGDYPDRRYFDQVVIPHYVEMTTENQPMVHRIRTTVQGRLAIYDRLMLPYLGKETRIGLSLSRVLLVVDHAAPTTGKQLSPRERQCLVHIVDGRSAKWGAAEDELSVRTVQNTIERLKAKLGARNITEAAGMGALLLSPRQNADTETPQASSLLSPRERQCLGLLASGCSWRQAAAELRLAPKTVEKHIESLKAKLGARNAAEAVAKGLRLLAG